MSQVFENKNTYRVLNKHGLRFGIYFNFVAHLITRFGGYDEARCVNNHLNVDALSFELYKQK